MHTHSHAHTLMKMLVDDMSQLKWCGGSSVDAGRVARWHSGAEDFAAFGIGAGEWGRLKGDCSYGLKRGH